MKRSNGSSACILAVCSCMLYLLIQTFLGSTWAYVAMFIAAIVYGTFSSVPSLPTEVRSCEQEVFIVMSCITGLACKALHDAVPQTTAWGTIPVTIFAFIAAITIVSAIFPTKRTDWNKVGANATTRFAIRIGKTVFVDEGRSLKEYSFVYNLMLRGVLLFFAAQLYSFWATGFVWIIIGMCGVFMYTLLKMSESNLEDVEGDAMGFGVMALGIIGLFLGVISTVWQFWHGRIVWNVELGYIISAIALSILFWRSLFSGKATNPQHPTVTA